jgi:hypothetical protein
VKGSFQKAKLGLGTKKECPPLTSNCDIEENSLKSQRTSRSRDLEERLTADCLTRATVWAAFRGIGNDAELCMCVSRARSKKLGAGMWNQALQPCRLIRWTAGSVAVTMVDLTLGLIGD